MVFKYLNEWVKANNAIEKAKELFWEHVDEYKTKLDYHFEDYTTEQIKTMEVHMDRMYVEIYREETEKLVYAIELYTLIHDEGFGTFKVKFDKNCEVLCYEIW